MIAISSVDSFAPDFPTGVLNSANAARSGFVVLALTQSIAFLPSKPTESSAQIEFHFSFICQYLDGLKSDGAVLVFAVVCRLVTALGRHQKHSIPLSASATIVDRVSFDQPLTKQTIPLVLTAMKSDTNLRKAPQGDP